MGDRNIEVVGEVRPAQANSLYSWPKSKVWGPGPVKVQASSYTLPVDLSTFNNWLHGTVDFALCGSNYMRNITEPLVSFVSPSRTLIVQSVSS